ncbi:MAG TPA: hypothetical protein VK152_11650 [Paludibacter sp.]|nr:hypothetical protein [Paludibacter sp.]
MILDAAQNSDISQYLTPAIVSLITLAVALPIQAKLANSKALETLEKVYGRIIDKLEARVKVLEERYNTHHCEKAPQCRDRVK